MATPDNDTSLKDSILALGGVIAVLVGVFYWGGAIWWIKWVLLGSVALFALLIYADHIGKKHKERLEHLQTHINGKDIAKRDLTSIRDMLTGSEQRKKEALDLLQEQYGDTNKRLIQILADDERKLSRDLIKQVVNTLHNENDDICSKGYMTLSHITIPSKNDARFATKTAIDRLRHADTRQDRLAYLNLILNNRNHVSRKKLTKHRFTIAEQFEVDDPQIATKATILTELIASYKPDAAAELIQSIMAHISKLINTDLEKETRAVRFDSFLRLNMRSLAKISNHDTTEEIAKGIPILRTVLKTGEEPVVKYAAHVAEQIAKEDSEAIEPITDQLFALLDSENKAIQRSAVETLAYHDPDSFGTVEETVPRLVSLLEDDDERRRASIFLLHRIASEHHTRVADHIDHLDAVLSSDDVQTREYGYWCLAKLAHNHPDHVAARTESLIMALEHDEAAGQNALLPLHRYFFFHDESVAVDIGERLVPYLGNGGDMQKIAAQMLASAIKQEPDNFKSLRPVIEDLLDHEDEDVVQQACNALKVIGNETSREKLQELLEHSSHKVRIAATKAYKIIGDENINEDEAEQEDENIHIEAGSTVEGDILIEGDKTDIDELDKSKDISDSVMKDVEFDD